MSVREIVTIGDPVLRRRAREVTSDQLATPEVQGLIDDLIETRRAANGAGLAANQIGEQLRIAVVENDGDNPRYPYKPPIELRVLVNPTLEPVDDETVAINEGCLSVPDLRGDLERWAGVRAPLPGPRRRAQRGGRPRAHRRHLPARGRPLDGVLFVDRADPRSLATWEQFERHGRDEFVARAEEIVRRFGS